jgi:hypothetical protein
MQGAIMDKFEVQQNHDFGLPSFLMNVILFMQSA